MNPLAATGLACRHEVDVQQAAASGRWPASLATHAATCPTCAEVRLISEAFATGGSVPRSSTTVDPALLFARARHERRLSTEVRISLVTTVTQLLLLVGVLGVVVLFAPLPDLSSLTWPSFARWPDLSFPQQTESVSWSHAAAAFVMASVAVLVRWTSQDA